MIKEFEFFHGVALARIAHRNESGYSISSYPTLSNSSYTINNKVGLYIKYSTKRMSPWSFSFKKTHQDEILEMKNKIGEVYTVLVCNNDGIVCLSFDELKRLLDAEHNEIEWISVSRSAREKYLVKGSDGKLKYKIGNNEFPEKIFLPVKDKPGVFSWFKQ